VEKHYNNPQYFKEKNYKAKLSTSSILKKIKSTKTILKKKHKKNKKKRRQFWKKNEQKQNEKKWKEKHVKKVKAKFSTSSILKRNSTKIIF
jgi:hypothetical protein